MATLGAFALLAAVPALAAAAERYAAPGGATTGTCPQATPCRIDRAINLAAQFDTVVIAPGEYDVSATPLSNSSSLTVRGEDIASKPEIVASGSAPALDLGPETLLLDVAAHYTGSGGKAGLTVGPGSAIERVVASSTGLAALFTSKSLVRDAALFSSGSSGTALYLYGTGESFVRNVTALAFGPSSYGIAVRSPSGSAVGNVRNSIARGTETDIGTHADFAGTSATIDIDYSNYQTALGDGQGSVSFITGSHNQKEDAQDPLFVSAGELDVHQQPGSPTIDAGVSDGAVTALDFEGDPRPLGSAPDIGADEYVPPVPASPQQRSPEPPPPGTPPSLTGLSITKKVFLAPNTPKGTGSKLPRRTKFSFFLNQNATVRVIFKQARKGGRLVRRGTLTRNGVTGRNVIRFAGKTPKPKGGVQFLSAGRYRAFFTARNENGASAESSIGFRLVPPRI